MIIYLLEIKDIFKWTKNILDKIKFLFSKPKYKIGLIFEYHKKIYRITSITREWESNSWTYHTNSNILSFSEGLIDYYLKKEIKTGD